MGPGGLVDWWMARCKHAVDTLQACCEHAAVCPSTNRVMIMIMNLIMNVMKLLYFLHAFC